MNKSLKIIVITIGIIISIIVILILLLVKNKNENKITDIYYDSNWSKENIIEEGNNIHIFEEEKKVKDYEVKCVDEGFKYFTIQGIADKYVSLVMMGDKDGLKKIISSHYIKKYNINDNNILNIADIPKSNEYRYDIIFNDMKECNNGDKIIYFVDGKGILYNENRFFTYKIMIEVDNENKLYAIYPERFLKDNNLNSIKIGDTIKSEYFMDVADTGDNSFIYMKAKTDSEMASLYLHNYKELLIYDKEEAYKKLNKDYANKRFQTKEGFYNYVDENKLLIALMSADKYKVIKKDEYTDYIISDKYNNIYTIRREKGVMDYSVFLDNYTILSTEDTNKYNEYSSLSKAKYNLNIFLKMLNTKDYKAIYNLLDNSFKINNFKDVNDLKKYISDNCYDINILSIEREVEKDNYYVFACKLGNMNNTNEIKDVNIIISKTNDTNFKMSFSF